MAIVDTSPDPLTARREQTLLLQVAELQRQIQGLQTDISVEKAARRAAEREQAVLTRKLTVAEKARQAATAAALIAAGKVPA